MYNRGKSKDEEKQNKMERYVAQITSSGKKKWVRYNEGALLYSMGIHSFMDLAKEAKAVYRIKRICLVNTEKLDEYLPSYRSHCEAMKQHIHLDSMQTIFSITILKY